MATCNLCPPGAREVPDPEMAAHLRSVHPEVDADGTRRGDASRIVPDNAEAAAPPEEGEWRSS
jgi:hypothetical protein